MHVCRKLINMPVLFVVSAHEDKRDGLLRDLNHWTQGMLDDYHHPQFPPNTIFAVKHNPGGKTHVIPWEWNEWDETDFGDTSMAESDFKSPYVDETFQPDVSYAKLLDWAEDRMNVHLTKIEENLQEEGVIPTPSRKQEEKNRNADVRFQLNSHMM